MNKLLLILLLPLLCTGCFLFDNDGEYDDVYLHYQLVNKTDSLIGMELEPEQYTDKLVIYAEAGDSAEYLWTMHHASSVAGVQYIKLYSFADTTSLFIYNSRLANKYYYYNTYYRYTDFEYLTGEDSLLVSCYSDTNIYETRTLYSWESITVTDTLKTLFTKDTSMLTRYKEFYP